MIALLRVAGPALAAMALIASAPVRAITPSASRTPSNSSGLTSVLTVTCTRA